MLNHLNPDTPHDKLPPTWMGAAGFVAGGLVERFRGKGVRLPQPEANGVFLREAATLGKELSVWGGDTLDAQGSWEGPAAPLGWREMNPELLNAAAAAS